MVRVLIAMVGLIFSNASYCGVLADMKKWVASSGVQHNVTSPDFYSLQGGHYAHGGSLMVRNPVKNIQPIRWDLPNWSVSNCGNLNFNAGGLGIMSKDEFVDALKNILTGVPAYAFMLGLSVVSPQLKNLLAWLNDVKTKIHQISANTCDLTSLLVGGAVSQNETLRDHWCKMNGVGAGKWSNRLAGSLCTKASTRQEVENAAVKQGKFILSDNYNIAFEAMKRNAVLKEFDEEMQALVMAITGSFVVVDGEIEPVTSDVHNGIAALLSGGTVAGYKCNDEKCLNVVGIELDIPFEKSMSGQMYELLDLLAQAAVNGEKIDGSTLDKVNKFLSNSHFAVYDNMIANIAATGGISPLKLQEYSEVLAIDLISEYLFMLVREMRKGLATVKPKVSHDDVVTDFNNGLDEVKKVVTVAQRKVYKKAGINNRINKETQHLRRNALSNLDITAFG